jgi:uncharacterized protein (TIGR03435 family)
VLKTALILLAPLALRAQSFEVASVKPADPDARGNTFDYTPGGGLTIRNSTLRGLVQSAYDVPRFQIQGGPGWMDSDRFDIFAKSEGGSGDIRQTRLKLQALLADRFQLRARRENRELPIYVLTLGKNGPKLTESGNASTAGVPDGMHMQCGRAMGTNTTMANFAHSLTRDVGRPVEDRTGLSAKYNFQVDFTPDSDACGELAVDRPSLFGALLEQLGLKLESTKGPVEIIVVDHAEKPAGN